MRPLIAAAVNAMAIENRIPTTRVFLFVKLWHSNCRWMPYDSASALPISQPTTPLACRRPEVSRGFRTLLIAPALIHTIQDKILEYSRGPIIGILNARRGFQQR